jgi:hypothetical protein
MRPVAAVILSPVGSPVALNVSGSPTGSVATICSPITSPSVWDWLPGFVSTGGGLVIVILSDWLVSRTGMPASVAVKLTVTTPASLEPGVRIALPLPSPVSVKLAKAGRPLAVSVGVSPSGSVVFMRAVSV